MPGPRGTSTPEEPPTSTAASSPPQHATGNPPASGPPASAPTSTSAPSASTPPVLHSADVFQDTDEDSTAPDPPVSRRFQEDGDAHMDGASTCPAKQPFSSDLQTQARKAKPTKQDGWKTVTSQRKPARGRHRVPDARNQPRSKTSVSAGDSARQTASKTPPRRGAPANVWSTQGAAQLRASLRGTEPVPAHPVDGVQSQDVDPALSIYYACATRVANLRYDGDQRAMSKLEQMTLFKWMNREIHPPGPPLFLSETHTSAEQDFFADYARNHMGYRLYGILPAGVTLSESNPKYHICNTALLANRDPPTRTALEGMLLAAQVITSEPKSKIVVLRYTWPQQRDQWRGMTFNLGSGTVTMQATDSLTTDVPRVGLDDNARALLYQVHARGHSTINHSVVRSIFAAAAKTDVFDVQSVESQGLADFSPHKWVIAFPQITCPTALGKVGRLDVQHGEQRLIFKIQHPCAARRAPCTKCLSIRHGTNDCANKQVQRSLKRHTLVLQVQPAVSLPKLTAAISPANLKTQLSRLRQLAAPELEARLRKEKKEQKAETKKQVAQAAANVARDAAREARLVEAARRHEEEDRARNQLRRTQRAQREVTRQLAALQAEARANRTRNVTPPTSAPHDEGSSHGEPGSAAPSTGGGEEEVSGKVEEPGAALGPSQSETSSEPTETDEGEAEREAPNSADKGGEESAESQPNETDACEDPNAVGTRVESFGSQASDAAHMTLASQDAPAAPATGGANAAHETTSLAGASAAGEPANPTATVPPVTGKRATPPSPSSSDDEEHRHAKWSQAPLTPPFSADISPIPGVEDATLSLADVDGRALTKRSGRRQLPPREEQEPDAPADARPKRRQQALSEFYGPETLADAQARLEREIEARQSNAPAQLAEKFPSPALDDKLSVLRSPSLTAAWKKAFGARVVTVPGNGGCLYYALYCCRTGWKLTGVIISVASTHSVEANHYKTGVCKEYQAYLDQMLSDGTVTIADLTRRYFNAKRTGFDKQARTRAVKAIRKFIDGIAGANLGGKGLERSQWAGDAELFASVWYIQEPLFIISVDGNGMTSVRIIWLERALSDGPERIVQFFPDAGEAYEIIRTFLRHRALPTVIVHTTLERGAGHYDAFRFPEAFYTEWTADDNTGKAMRRRMDPALASLGWYVAPIEADGIPKTVIVSVDSSGSVYEPSHPSQLSLRGTQLSPDAPLSPPAHYGLLSALNPRVVGAAGWRVCGSKPNGLTYKPTASGDSAQLCDEPRTELDTVEAGCGFWSAQIPQLVALLRALPYPEVAMSLLKPELVVHLGNELNDIGTNGSVPEFVRAEDPVEARRQWVQHGAEPSVRQAPTPSHGSTPALTAQRSSEPMTDYPAAQPALRRRLQSTHPTLRLLSQNVQGLAKTWDTVLSWFDGFRGHGHGGKLDFVILQETRATERWADQLQNLYSRAWGYEPSRLPKAISYWPATPAAAGGVAVLLHPDSALINATPWRQDKWSPHFVTVCGEFDGAPVTVACIYAPFARVQRERLFAELADLSPPHGLVLLGGDFNCSLDPELDRSRRSLSSPVSKTLTRLLESWSLVDAVTDDMLGADTPEAVARFHARYHTYMYQNNAASIATARLDRWYVSRQHYGQVGAVTTASPVARADHDSVTIAVHAHSAPPASRGRRSPRLTYPLPACAADAIRQFSHDIIVDRTPALTDMEPAAAATAWDDFKLDARRGCLRVRRERLAAATTRYRTRVRRLRRALYDARAAASTVDPVRPTLESITTHMAALALDPAARYRSIRSTLTALNRSRSSRTGIRRHALHAGRPHESARAFYRRISTRFARRAARSLPPAPGQSLGAADRIARDWRPIIQRPACDEALQDLYFRRLPAKDSTPSLDELDEPFTETEVASAIKACPRGKVCGPDGLGNDWYRDHADDLAPVLASLFTQWHATGVIPPSFTQATVHCVPKHSMPKSGLDFRPISLLNTDYKIYARLLLQRVRSAVPRLVANTQFGFVPGKQVHDPIDIWSAFQCLARRGDIPATAAAVLLDFAKAYDTLDWRFLSLALRRHGFSPTLVRAVEQMHLGTTAAYVADGQTSAMESVTNGIRQGCPLTPTLFILAIDVLYEFVVANPLLPGLRLDSSHQVSIVGFADDTKVYVSTPHEAAELARVLDAFAEVSGLVVNKAESIAVRLLPSPMDVVTAAGFPLAPLERLVRYLGAQISTTPQPGQVWDVTLQQLRARLILAEVKTTDLLQRVQVCRTIILPKVLYVARHTWPSAKNIQRIQRFVHNYAWHGRLADDGVVRRAWMSTALAAAGHADGGLNLPNVRDELLLMSAATVARWLSAHASLAATIGRILLRSRTGIGLERITPARAAVPAPRVCASLASSGIGVLRLAASHGRREDEAQAIEQLLHFAGRAPLREGWWSEGRYCRDYSRQGALLDGVARVQLSRFGRLNLASLRATPILGQGLLLGLDGRELTTADLPGLPCSSVPVSDLIDIQWVRRRVVRFRLRTGEYPYAAASSFRTLCDLLVFNYQDLIERPTEPSHLIEHSSSTDLCLSCVDDAVRLIRTTATRQEQELGIVQSVAHAQQLARQATGRRRVHFEPHPLLCPVLPLWGSVELFSKRRLRTLIAHTASRRVKEEQAAQAQRAGALSTDFAAALVRIDWAEIFSLPDSSSRQRQLFLKVKGLRLSGWDVPNSRHGCPHCAAAGHDGGSTFHIVWDCPSARRLWATVRSWWSALGLWPRTTSADDRDFLSAVFSLRLPRTPPRVWAMASLSQHPGVDDAPEGPFLILQAIWQQLVLETLVVILGWRYSRHDPERAWSDAQAAAIHATSCQRVLDTLARRRTSNDRAPPAHERLLTEVKVLIRCGPQDTALPDPPAPADLHVLFFDRGSRGNPGSGGLGFRV